ncbi:MAG: DUF3631 domain-containing protein [Micavibrio sp.]|nr:DUF3631 domain-containing protein [Micavibrio sp.]
MAIADLIGGTCSETARLAALSLAKNEQGEENVYPPRICYLPFMLWKTGRGQNGTGANP